MIKFFSKRTIYKGIILITILCIFSYITISSIRNDNHFGIKKHSLLWIVLIDNDIISDYPIIDPVEEAEYGWLGYNSTPHSITEWNIEYVSKQNPKSILNQNIKYLKKYNYHLRESNGIACGGDLSENTYYFTTTEDCITLALTPEKENKTRVKFYFIR